jgi:hypothetical protein
MKMDQARALGAPRCVHVQRRGVHEGGPNALGTRHISANRAA